MRLTFSASWSHESSSGTVASERSVSVAANAVYTWIGVALINIETSGEPGFHLAEQRERTSYLSGDDLSNWSGASWTRYAWVFFTAVGISPNIADLIRWWYVGCRLSIYNYIINDVLNNTIWIESTTNFAISWTRITSNLMEYSILHTSTVLCWNTFSIDQNI